MYRQIHKSKYKKRGVTNSDVLRAALVVLREEVMREFKEIKTRNSPPLDFEMTDADLENLSKYAPEK